MTTNSGASSPLVPSSPNPILAPPVAVSDRSPQNQGSTGSKWKSMFRLGNKPSRTPLPTWAGADGQEVLSGEMEKLGHAPGTPPVVYTVNGGDEPPRMYSEAAERSSGLSGVDKSYEYQRSRHQTPPTPTSHTDRDDESSIHVPLTPVSGSARPRQIYQGSSGPSNPRPYSSATSHSHSTSTTRSSDSSRIGNAAGQSQSHLASSTSSRPLPSPAASFKGRFFSAPQSDAGSSTSSKQPKQAKSEKYKSLSKGSKVKDPSASSASVASPRTPGREVSQPPAQGLPTPPESTSATTRFLRRVVSAPNAKALFSAQLFTSQPAMPPNASETAAEAASAPVTKPTLIIPNSQSSNSIASPVDLVESPPPLPKLTLNPSPDVPLNKGTRAGRAHSTSQVGSSSYNGKLGPKQAFRRTYSSNSIKVKSVRDLF